MKYRSLDIDPVAGKVTLHDGKELLLCQVTDIHSAFERMCTYDYISQCYDNLSPEVMWKIADKARELMNDLGYIEDMAIDEAIEYLEVEV